MDCPDISIYHTDMPDRYHLQRFVDAQDGIYDEVCAELRQGGKQSHWIWFIFPQIQRLGHSPTAIHFAISSREEAVAYLDHRVLGPRLRECTRLVTLIEGRAIRQILGYPDDLKFRSSMTLFANVTADNQIFLDALQKFFAGEFDPLTMERLRTDQA